MSARLWGWRKYECPVSVSLEGREQAPYALWPCADPSGYPRLPRWEYLDTAFVGYISVRQGPFRARAYDAVGVLELLRQKILTPTWYEGPDAASLYEFMKHDLCGVWLGEGTPFMLTDTPDFCESLFGINFRKPTLKTQEHGKWRGM